MNYWWVNQKQTARHEIGNGYLWSPKRQGNDRQHFSYEFMKQVQPGDIVFSYANAHIIAIGLAKTYCYSFPKPQDFGRVGGNWSEEGWKIEINYHQLADPIRPSHHMQVLAPLLPKIYSPIQVDGRGNQAYLFKIEQSLAFEIAQLVGAEIFELVKGNYVAEPRDVADTVNIHIQEWEDRIEKTLLEEVGIDETERESIIRARRGQGKFRELLLFRERSCRVKGVEKHEHLIASHIKPWRSGNNYERLDPENGFMLTPSIDHLFDKGFISFDNNGSIVLADVADRSSMERMGVIGADVKTPPRPLSQGQLNYIEWHRENILLT